MTNIITSTTNINTNIMDKISLTWAIVWGIMFVAGVVGIFWNPAHFVTIIASGGLCICYIKDYIKYRPKK